MVTIREALKSDLVEVVNLFKDLMGTISQLDKITRTFECMQNDESYTLLVAEYKGEIVGAVMGILCYDLIGECKPFMILKNIVVSKTVRDASISKKLISEIEAIAKSYNAGYITVMSNDYKNIEHAFYTAVGYEVDTVQGLKKLL